MSAAPIGIFDSGVGGLSILGHIRDLLPHEDCLYFADQAHIPYGSKTQAQVLDYSRAITQFLLEHGAKIIVVSCNTASAAALQPLRLEFPKVPIVGMEPAIKPALAATKSGRIGVLATPVTFLGEQFNEKVELAGRTAEIFNRTLPGMVELIEAGEEAGQQAGEILDSVLSPLLAAGVDTLVLACTHYPFVQPLIRSRVPAGVVIIDPAPAIARQTARVLAESGLTHRDPAPGHIVYFSSASAIRLAASAERLIAQSGEPRKADWDGGKLHPGDLRRDRNSQP